MRVWGQQCGVHRPAPPPPPPLLGCTRGAELPGSVGAQCTHWWRALGGREVHYLGTCTPSSPEGQLKGPVEVQ
jgi:hypothetical protein